MPRVTGLEDENQAWTMADMEESVRQREQEVQSGRNTFEEDR